MANGNGNGQVTFRVVAMGCAALIVSLLGFWGANVERKIETLDMLANSNKTAVVTVQAIVTRMEAKIDKILDKVE